MPGDPCITLHPCARCDCFTHEDPESSLPQLSCVPIMAVNSPHKLCKSGWDKTMLALFSFLRDSLGRMGSSKVFMTSSVTSACNVSGFSLSWKHRWSSRLGDCTIIPNGHTAHWPTKLRRRLPLSSPSNLLKLSFRLGIKTEAC